MKSIDIFFLNLTITNELIESMIKKSVRMSDSSIQFARPAYKISLNQSHAQSQTPKLPNVQSSTFQQNFKIYLRIKPIIVESQPNRSPKLPQECVRIHSRKKVEIIPPYYTSETEKLYNYEQVFNGRINSEQVFQKTMIVPILNALSGYNSTVFIYGMTGSGKTFTMFGEGKRKYGDNRAEREIDSNANCEGQGHGLVGMTIDYMFKEINSKKDVKTQVFVSFFEIYNENIRDLLQENSANLTVMDDPSKGVIINDLKEAPIQHEEQAKKIIIEGLERRAMNATKSNELSSRSHAILQFSIRRYVPHENDNQVSVLESKFFMIDLAGNQKTGNNQAKRFIEGVNINKSLLTLGKCISILAEQKKSSFVPFRDSKLTRILKESLGGNSKTVMIACISSEKRFYEETLNTLKYSTIARRIKNKGIKNNVKLISKDQLPSQRDFVTSGKKSLEGNQEEVSKKFRQIMSRFIALIEEKTTIQRLKSDLELSRVENQHNLKNGVNVGESRKYLSQISGLIQRMSTEYAHTLRSAEQHYQLLINEIFCNKICKENSDRNEGGQSSDIQRLNQTIKKQKGQIRTLEEKLMRKQQKPIQEQHRNEAIYNPFSDKENKQVKKSPKTFEIFTTTTKINPRKKPQLNLQCTDTQQSFCEISNPQNRSANQSQIQFPISQQQPEIVINLSSSTSRRPLPEKYHNSSTAPQENREEFIRRLRQTEKRAKGTCNQDISILLQEQEICKYDLRNVEQSMLRKLKFFQKERPAKQSQSLGGNCLLSQRAASFKRIARLH